MSFDVLPTTWSLTVVTRPPSRPTDAVIRPAQWRRRVTHHGSRGPRQRGMLVLLLQWRHRSITITTAGLPHTCSCFIIANDVTWQTQATSHGHCLTSVDNSIHCKRWVFNPLTTMGTVVKQKHPVPDRVKLSFVIFDIRALWRSAMKYWKLHVIDVIGTGKAWRVVF